MNKTPRVDALLARLQPMLEERGRKAELIKHLAGSDSPNAYNSWKSILSKTLKRTRTPSGETILAIQEWMDGAASKKTRRGKRAYI